MIFTGSTNIGQDGKGMEIVTLSPKFTKIFEALAMKKALLLGVNGEAKEHFIDKGNAGLHFEPENINELAECIRKFSADPNIVKEMGENAREYVRRHFDRNNIAADFLSALNNI